MSLAQVVYDPQHHPTEDGAQPSETDANKMLGAYSLGELPGGPNGGVHRHARSALSLANDLQPHRTATYRQAALCSEATISVVNLVAIISGRREKAD